VNAGKCMNIFQYMLPYGEHRLRVYKNRVLRRIFGPKREEVMG
jgi:hypothetical protein